jgi:hypothetical protein
MEMFSADPFFSNAALVIHQNAIPRALECGAMEFAYYHAVHPSEQKEILYDAPTPT